MPQQPDAHDSQPTERSAVISPRRLLFYIVVLGAGAIAGFYTVELATGERARLSEAPRPAESAQNRGAATLAEDSSGSAHANTGALETLLVHDEPKPVPAFEFVDDDGQTRTLEDWRGKVVLVNIWATWCPPCVKEMPALNRLQGIVGEDDFAVLPISIDRGGLKQPRAFLEEIEADNLPVLLDETARLNFTLQALGLPATVIIDRQGREIARMIGPAEWDDQEAVAFIRSVTDK